MQHQPQNPAHPPFSTNTQNFAASRQGHHPQQLQGYTHTSTAAPGLLNKGPSTEQHVHADGPGGAGMGGSSVSAHLDGWKSAASAVAGSAGDQQIAHAHGMGVCFHSPSTSSLPSSLTSPRDDSTTGSGSSCSKHSSQGAPTHYPAHPPVPGTTALLCDIPSISIDSPSSTGPAGKHAGTSAMHCHAAAHSAGRAGSGMNSHQLDVSCKPSFALPSLQSMLGAGADADASKCCVPLAPAAATTAPAATGPNKASHAALPHSHMGQQAFLSKPVATTADPAHGPQAAAQGPSPNSSSTAAVLPLGHAETPPAGSASNTSPDCVQVFLRACATPAAVAALAVLAHNEMLPVLPIAQSDAAPTDNKDLSRSSLTSTLAHMFVLATRAGVLGRLNDTTIRTLLWMTESLFSQYRSSCKTAAFDYCFYASGLQTDDPFVADSLAEEVPAIIQLQLQILLACGFKVLVSEQQLMSACSTLTQVQAACSSSSDASILVVHDRVNKQLEEYNIILGMMVRSNLMQANEPAAEQQQLQKPQAKLPQLPPAPQLFAGEVVTGMLTGTTVDEADECFEPNPQQQLQHQEPTATKHFHCNTHNTASLRQVDTSMGDAERAQKADVACVGISGPAPTGRRSRAEQAAARLRGSNQQQQKRDQPQQHTRQTRQQQRQFKQQLTATSADPPVTKAHTRSNKRVKDQLLQLADREQAVGCKRRRSATSAPAAGAGVSPAGARQQQVQQGGLAGLGEGSKRLLERVMKTARSAAHYLGCRPQ